MNQDTVKEKLQSIHKSPVDYTVIFSGKKSAKVNRLYKPLSKEIIIHNMNFIDGEGKQNENLLIITAIHELAHHVVIAEKGNESPRAHSQDFWVTFHDLLDVAEKKGIYRAEIDAETQKFVDDAREIDRQIAEL
jgi:fructose 1,6-bisphosphatase